MDDYTIITGIDANDDDDDDDDSAALIIMLHCKFIYTGMIKKNFLFNYILFSLHTLNKIERKKKPNHQSYVLSKIWQKERREREKKIDINYLNYKMN
jgi:hypothetical protein